HAGFDRFEEVWRKVKGTESDMGAGATNEWVTRWLDERADNPAARDRPFFLFVNYFEPHLPYNAPEPERTRFVPAGSDPAAVDRLRRFKYPLDVQYILGQITLEPAELALLSDLYDGEIAYVDRRIGEIVGALKRNRLFDDTVVVVTSDHGEMLGEHHLVDHKLSVYEPVLRIPMVVRYPGRVRAGQRITTPVMLQDLYPTLLALAGVPADPSPKSDFGPEARSLPGIEGITAGRTRGADPADPILAEYASPSDFLQVIRREAPEFDASIYHHALLSWQVGTRKLIWSTDGAHHLYDLGTDPGESVDLGAGDASDVSAIASRVETWLARPGSRPPLSRPR
ncbi:MAG TPA: sulfatase-like hydrolase/transferase, partial [Candidatus Polarisedimenticolia bacterium]|nr:sulfatase-like hydrolase/transferase [Candidatus Polarisedimenticolia bacterium]